jgi:hypothetical protein
MTCRLNISSNSRTYIKNVCSELLEEGPSKDMTAKLSQRGRKPLIQDYTEQAGVAYRALGTGLSTGQTAALVNEWRSANGLELLSWSAVENFRLHSDCIDTSRHIKKSGKKDPDSQWSMARLSQCLQWLEMYEDGLKPRNKRTSTFPPLFLDGLALWDEHHQKIVLGKYFLL